MIAYHAADLIWATRIKGAAEAAGVAARPVRTVEMLAARLADSPVRMLIVDLETGEAAIDLIRMARGRDRAGGAGESGGPGGSGASGDSVGSCGSCGSGGAGDSGGSGGPVRIIAFGPHVDTGALALAREAGADLVLTRGAFHHRLADLVRESGAE